MIGTMSAIRYPVALTPHQALSKPLGRAVREREAARLADDVVAFVTEPAGPLFATREAALDAFAGRIEDDRPGRTSSLPPEDRYLRLTEVATARLPAPARPSLKDGRRWPEAKAAPATAWRVTVSYWRIGARIGAEPAQQARQARRAARDLPAEDMRALTRQPLRAFKPQQPLDIGLFETRLPEAPHIIVPDE